MDLNAKLKQNPKSMGYFYKSWSVHRMTIKKAEVFESPGRDRVKIAQRINTLEAKKGLECLVLKTKTNWHGGKGTQWNTYVFRYFAKKIT